MMKKDQLDKLFVEWKKAHHTEPVDSLLKTINGDNIDKDFFEIDGIIDEDAFSKESTKILFISAEANADEYSAKKGIKETNYCKVYIDYYKSEKDDWKGKMRERISAIYGCITNQPDVPFNKLANRFAVMDINKRGGKSTLDGGEHIKCYAQYYKEFIKREIEIISPDLIVWIGTNLIKLEIPLIVGFIEKNGILFFETKDKQIPSISIWQTSYYQAKIEPLSIYKNRTIGKLCAKAKLEMESLKQKLPKGANHQ